ncbi:MAG: hypothetical protein GX452_03810 [Ignavibacteriales bacterium]|nr:hypothetical protein [Ignavibacteriales bacterium]
MKNYLSAICLIVVLAILSGNFSTTNAQKAPKDSKIKQCNVCHKEGKNKFDEYKTWLFKTHSNNTKALTTEKGKEFATANKITDSSKSDVCLKCHVNKFDKEMKFKPADIKCEDCHDSKSKIHTIKEKYVHPKGA